ncbi:poly-beta-1,6-N-acetyl-D-glucosamine N-deacetylase PgaB [Acinetobacter sp.]|uniref:poly-beta-1,6-N-acetyl-D-glucosamine N-deacetylase PgaB n=1 Tax=Acinetobacter sp. TaxID=472 RepID=UPI0031D9C962
MKRRSVLLSSLLGSSLLCMMSMSHAQDIQANLKNNQSIALNFHDVRDDVLRQGDKDVYAISTQNLAVFFDWLSRSDWHPVTLKQIMEARQGKKALPKNAILLSFDDGTLSGYTHVYPLLKQYRLPAVFAIVTSWSDGRNDGGEKAYGKGNFMTWAQMREMQQSGLVEFASHSDALHQGVLANPQGNQEPAAITRQYLKSLNRYETDQEFEKRVRHDLQHSKQVLEQQLGVKIQTIIWPYGAVNAEVEQIAKNAGLPLSFSLGRSGVNSVYDGTLKRLLMTDNPQAENIREELLGLTEYSPPTDTDITHSIGLNLDDLMTATMPEEEQRLGVLLERLKAMSVQRVFVDALRYDQNQWTALFPNRYLPVKKDVLNRFVWQAKTRISTKVYLKFPFSFNAQPEHLSGLVVDAMKNNTGVSGLVFDLDNQNKNVWMESQDLQQTAQLEQDLTAIQQIKQQAQKYSNLSGVFKVAVHQQLQFNSQMQLKPVLQHMLKYTDFVYLTITLPKNNNDQQLLLKQLNDLERNVKQKLVVSFDLSQLTNEKDWINVQKTMISLQQAGIQNIGVDHYQLKNSRSVQQYLYTPLSLNDSPLSYENPFKLEPYVERYK